MFGERMRGGVIELHAPGDGAIMKNWNCNQRLDATATALFRIDKEFRADVGRAENLAGPKAGQA